jgi:hypothetical protein
MIESLLKLSSCIFNHKDENKEIEFLIRYLSSKSASSNEFDSNIEKESILNNSFLNSFSSIPEALFYFANKLAEMNDEEIAKFESLLEKSTPFETLYYFASKLEEMNDKGIAKFESLLQNYVKTNDFRYNKSFLVSILGMIPEYVSFNLFTPYEIISLFLVMINETDLNFINENLLMESFELLKDSYKYDIAETVWYDLKYNKGFNFNRIYNKCPNFIDKITYFLIKDDPSVFYDLDIYKYYLELPYEPMSTTYSTPKLDEINILKQIVKKNPVYFLINNLSNKIDKNDYERIEMEQKAAENVASLPDIDLIWKITFLFDSNFSTKFPFLFEKARRRILNTKLDVFSKIRNTKFAESQEGKELIEEFAYNLVNQKRYNEFYLMFHDVKYFIDKEYVYIFEEVYHKFSDQERKLFDKNS